MHVVLSTGTAAAEGSTQLFLAPHSQGFALIHRQHAFSPVPGCSDTALALCILPAGPPEDTAAHIFNGRTQAKQQVRGKGFS